MVKTFFKNYLSTVTDSKRAVRLRLPSYNVLLEKPVIYSNVIVESRRIITLN